MLGLDSLGLDENKTVDLLRDLLVLIIGDRVTKPKAETLVNAILRNQKRAYAIIADKLLEIIPEGHLSPEQLEFVVSYIGDFAIKHAPRLYREMKRTGLDLSLSLQAAWEEAWRSRGEEGPIGYCPRCGFRSVDPEGVCMVCGHLLNEKELRKAVEFDTKFETFLEETECDNLRKALEEGKVYVNHADVSLEPKSKWSLEIFLNSQEKEKIRAKINLKCRQSSLNKILEQIQRKLT
jgi:hypothetical protein